MATKPTIFLLDAYALIFRSYYAFINRPMMSSKGINTSAIYGFTNTLFELLRKEEPDYMAVVFDPPGETFRDKIYPAYKANREQTPEAIKEAVPYIKMILEAFRIPVIEVVGYEADDVIGTLAKKAEKEGWMVYMMTPDKDYVQLISENIFIYKPARSGGEVEIIGLQQLQPLYGIEKPCQMIDVLSLWGDASDNIPGVPGIGEKTSKLLISKYKSIDNLLDKLNELNDKIRSNISNNQEQLIISRKLAKIVTDVPLNIEPVSLKRQHWQEEKLKQLFTELEFKTFLSRASELKQIQPAQGDLFTVAIMNNIEQSAEELDSLNTMKHFYRLINDVIELENLAVTLSGLESFCFDTETTNINPRNAEIVGMSIAYRAHEAIFISFPPDRNKTIQFLEILKPVFENPAIAKVGQNLKFDLQVLCNYEIEVKGPLFDTMIAHYLIEPELRHNLDFMAEIYLKYRKIKTEELIGKKGKDQKNMRQVDVAAIKDYACEDVDVTWQLYNILNREITQRNLQYLAFQIEMPLIRVLTNMENSGFRINTESLKAYSAVLQKEIINIETEIHRIAGISFNIASTKQLGEVLFDRLKIASDAKRTKSRQFSTSEEVLSGLRDKHPIINKILEFRALQKLLNTYVDALPRLIDPKTNKIHTSFDQAWVATGRLSSRNPNLQNIPIRDQKGREIRKAFIASDGNFLLMSADYSQIELRLMAHLSKDINMIDAFYKNEDIHAATAARIFKVSIKEVTHEMRTKAKTANFGIIYGISSFGLAQRLNISRTEASQLITDYFNSYRQVEAYIQSCIRIAREKEYVETILGRRRYLRDINSANSVVRGMAERNAVNAPIQGSAADIIKLAMVNIHNRIKDSYKTRMILQVHDELVFDVYEPEKEDIMSIVREEMEHVVKLDVPLIVDIGMGNNWLEAH